WVGAMGADLDVWFLFAADRGEHVIQLRLDLPAQARHVLGDIHDLEELLGIDLAAPDVIAVDVHDEAPADIQSRAIVNERLKGEVDQVHVFDPGGGFDLDDVPRVLRDRIQNINAGQPSVVNKPRLEQRLPFL